MSLLICRGLVMLIGLPARASRRAFARCAVLMRQAIVVAGLVAFADEPDAGIRPVVAMAGAAGQSKQEDAKKLSHGSNNISEVAKIKGQSA